MKTTCVIMAGGKGERFWPRSRINLPKQFINISGSKSMIQQTIDRLVAFIPYEQIFIITNELYAEIIKAQVPSLPTENIIIEPIGRNTAPCVGLASVLIEEKYPDSSMIVLPSDHIIRNEHEFENLLKTAVEMSEEGDKLITLGVSPTYPETGYGYIESTDEVIEKNNFRIFKVKKFTEKPDMDTASKFLQAGNYYWNSGIFVWRTAVIRECIRKFIPEMHDLLEAMKAAFVTNDREAVIKSEFHKMPEVSIDYGIMEQADNIHIIPCSLGWDDVGSWTALDRINEQDDNGNVIKGSVLSIDTKKCIIESNGKLIATLGIEDLIVVETEDVILICSKDKSQDIKSLIKELKVQKLEQYL